jgi:hypothetical protein
LKKFDHYFATSNLQSVYNNACQQQCENIDYNLALTTAFYPYKKYLKILKSNRLYTLKFQSARTDAELLEFSRYGLLKLIVDYDNFYYTSMVENPYAVWLFGWPIRYLEFFSGLFIGVSILSFFECLEVLIKILSILFKKRD